MRLQTIKFGAVAASIGAAVLALGLPASAQAQPYYGPVPAYARPLTVGGYREAPPVIVAPAFNPYAGPAALVTSPIAAAGTLVALPFTMVNAVFPAHGDPSRNPLVIVGAPVHAAGQIAQLPFRILQAPFQGQPNVYAY